MEPKPSYSELEERLRLLEQVKVQRDALEAQLAAEVHWRRLLVDESRDGIVVLDHDAKVFEANRRFADMLGYPLDDVRALHAWDWDAVYSREQILELAKEVDDHGHHFETRWRRRDGSVVDVELSNNGATYDGRKLIFCVCRDVTARKQAVDERERLVRELREALAELKTLRGILPICSHCKRIRDEAGAWSAVEAYVTKHSDASFSHGICPECFAKHYPDGETP